jgi:hypothetical protein
MEHVRFSCNGHRTGHLIGQRSSHDGTIRWIVSSCECCFESSAGRSRRVNIKHFPRLSKDVTCTVDFFRWAYGNMLLVIR